MQDREGLIKRVYKRWKCLQPKPETSHLDEEALVCFLEDRLTFQESDEIKKHLINCDDCCELVRLSLETGSVEASLDLPEGLLNAIRGLILEKDNIDSVLEIFLRLREKAFEIINTTGAVILGQELVPASVLRSRGLRDFKDEVVILKDFKDIRLEVKIENKQSNEFNLIINAKCKKTQKSIKAMRVSLFKDDLELESYLTDFGQVSFEHVLLGKYKVVISDIETKLAAVLLDIKV
ncbi:MAG: hypothetical protein QMD94_02235 [Candidatus Omnitrophota bacterium]|nr:hypothetical protein [Candidatus Omnitrophota bacterium]